MRAVIQRVQSASVTVDGAVVGSIQHGLLVFVAIHRDDTPEKGTWLSRKLLNMRIFEDDQGKMGRSVVDVNGGLLIVSQFTLYGDVRKGNRPDFGSSMPVESARFFYDRWLAELRGLTPLRVEAGVFAAHMEVNLVNDGPVTILIENE